MHNVLDVTITILHHCWTASNCLKLIKSQSQPGCAIRPSINTNSNPNCSFYSHLKQPIKQFHGTQMSKFTKKRNYHVKDAKLVVLFGITQHHICCQLPKEHLTLNDRFGMMQILLARSKNTKTLILSMHLCSENCLIHLIFI